jgi:pyruvate dehydrogenase E2 component (dihydrolipoamide acetyltransferase)
MGALTQVAVPDIGDFADVPVIEILVAVGDAVAVDDPLVVIESDKATMELPSPVAGVVREILVAVDDKVSEGTPIAAIDAAGQGAEEPTSAAGGEPTSAAREQPTSPRDEPDESGPPSAPPAGTAAGAAHEAPGGLGDASSPPEREWSGVYAGPVVRRRAREQGIDLRTVTGTGRRGRITLEDVESAGATPANGVAASGKALDRAPWPRVDFARYGAIERSPLTRVQLLAGANLLRNWTQVPHVTHHDEADVTELEDFRRRLNAEQGEVKVTMVALLLKAAAATLKAHPRFNSSLDGEELVLKSYYHLGFAADTPHGLVVPVIRDVDRKGLLEIAGELTELSSKARAGRLSPAEMSGATFTISSLGGIGGTGFTPIVNAPEVAILGAVRASMRPLWDGEQFRPRLVLPLSLSYDHRVIDGAAAARFCVTLAGALTDMRRVLL